MSWGKGGSPRRVTWRAWLSYGVIVAEVLGGVASLDDLLTGVRESLRLPYTAFRLDGRETATSGQPAARVEVLPLLNSNNGDMELVVGVRPGQSRLDPEDLRVLGVLAVAVRATVLSAELQASRQRLVPAREEERRRLRRDLHEGGRPRSTSSGWCRSGPGPGGARVSAALPLDAGGGRRVELTRSSPASPG